LDPRPGGIRIGGIAAVKYQCLIPIPRLRGWIRSDGRITAHIVVRVQVRANPLRAPIYCLGGLYQDQPIPGAIGVKIEFDTVVRWKVSRFNMQALEPDGEIKPFIIESDLSLEDIEVRSIFHTLGHEGSLKSVLIVLVAALRGFWLRVAHRAGIGEEKVA
jgi:hypothetical protein